MTDGPLFGTFPGRPDHPDFWKLSDIVLQHDGKTEDPGFDVEAHLARLLDPPSLLYMMKARVKRFLAMTRGTSDPKTSGGAIWLDGFMVGAAYARKHPEEAPDERPGT